MADGKEKCIALESTFIAVKLIEACYKSVSLSRKQISFSLPDEKTSNNCWLKMGKPSCGGYGRMGVVLMEIIMDYLTNRCFVVVARLKTEQQASI